MTNTPGDARGNFVHPTSPEEFAALCDYISLLARHREYEKSRHLLDLLIDLIRGMGSDGWGRMPNLWAGYQLMAENCLRTGEVSAAEGFYREGLRMFPHADALRLGLAECLTQLQQFEEAERLLHELAEPCPPAADREDSAGLCTYRKSTALGNLHQARGDAEGARLFFSQALKQHERWIPALVGLIEAEIVRGNPESAERFLAEAMNALGRDPALVLTAANIAIIAAKFSAAEELMAGLKGSMLGEDRFEYLLFLSDFFQGDQESLTRVPYLMRGETVETEAARVWLRTFQGHPREADPARIPEEVWKGEYDALGAAWQKITAGSTLTA